MTYPELCPICRCPIQLLCENSEPIGTIHDAMERHNAVVHPSEPVDHA